VNFSAPASELRIECRFRIERHSASHHELPLEPYAEHFPFTYEVDARIDLEPSMRPHSDDPDGTVSAWIRGFLKGGPVATRELLRRIGETLRNDFAYQLRNEQGTQSPVETLNLRSGSCRDLAWLMIEALRRLGLACRFVSGYLYDPAFEGGEVGVVGAGTTHAWLHVYLPGAGWVTYDPTNHLFSGTDLIRVAIARHPGQAVPLSGTFTGVPGDFLGMSVDVSVRKMAEAPER
jgi:transglutaminase-like putative cysteine protease